MGIMKDYEKVKIQKAVNKIQGGSFDENDLDLLLIKLRDLSNGFNVLKEISHFVAHNKQRDRGLIKDSVNANYYGLRYFVDFRFDGKMVNLSMFPLYLKKFLHLQIDRVNPLEFSKLRTNKKIVTDLISSIEENPQIEMAYLKSASPKEVQIMAMLSSTLFFDPIFSDSSFLNELNATLNKNSIGFDTQSLELQSDKIALCILVLLNRTPIKIPNLKPGLLFLGCNNMNSSENYSLIENYGNFIIYAKFELDFKPGKTIIYPIFSTSVNVFDHCDDSMFKYVTNSEGRIIKCLDLEQPFELDCDMWKLTSTENK